MKRTHWSINYSRECDRGGSGECDGFLADDDPGNPNAAGTSVEGTCTCPCHGEWDRAGVKVWHDEFHGVTATR